MSTADELKKLADLLEKGLLTREEYEEEKASLRAARSNPNLRSATDDAIGAYHVLGLLGEGGMGRVFRARHRSDAIAARQGGEVALKVLHDQYANNPLYQERFEREATVGLTLDHPGIVKVHDLVVDAGHLALAMELVSGRDLSEVIGEERGPLPWAVALPLFSQLLEAVAYAHERGVVHRDLKPENVMLCEDGSLKVLDFGIAKQMGQGKTKTGTGMGTVDYMAPEQYTDASKVDQRADVYALGMTLYEMLAGRLPWKTTDSEFGVLTKKSQGDIPLPTTFYPDIPPWLVGVVMAAIEVDLEGRIPSASGFQERLDVGENAEEKPASKKEAAKPKPTVQAPVAREEPAPSVPSTPQPDEEDEQPVKPSGGWNLKGWGSFGCILLGGAFSFALVALVGGIWLGLEDDGVTMSANDQLRQMHGYTFQRLEKGQSPQGSTTGDQDERPVHQVQRSHSALIGTTEVTQKMFREVMGFNPVETESRFWPNSKRPDAGGPCRAHGLGDTYPVHCVTWREAVEFCNRLSVQMGLEPVYEKGTFVWRKGASGYRLPTEAEWEAAARQPHPTVLNCQTGNGSNPSSLKLNQQGELVPKVTDTQSCEDGYPGLAPVANFRPTNGYYDLLGNVWEWMHDGKRTYGDNNLTVDPGFETSAGGSSGRHRVMRGGAWVNKPKDVRVSNRTVGPVDGRSYVLGFRLAQTVQSDE